NALYGELAAAAPDIVTTTVGDFLKEHPPQQQLHRLHTGSWIGASLDTWIGDPDHNTAWDLLAETRAWLAEQSRQRPKESSQAATAWREILITEGSDWFWWFSRKHDSGMDQIWDNQFRLHLRNVYKVMGQRAPARLFQPILQKAPTPGGDGAISLPLHATAAAEFGFEPSHVIRIEPRAGGGHITLARVAEPQDKAAQEAEWDAADPFFLKVPFKQLGRSAGEPIELALIVSRDGHDIEQ